MSIIGKLSGLVWDKENQRNREFVDKKFAKKEAELYQEYTSAIGEFSSETAAIKAEKERLYELETEAQHKIRPFLDQDSNNAADIYNQYQSASQLMALSYQRQILQANQQAGLQDVAGSSLNLGGNTITSTGNISVLPNTIGVGGTAMTSSGNLYVSNGTNWHPVTGGPTLGMGSAIGTNPSYSTIGLGASDKNVFFSLLRGIEEKAQFNNEETHPYDDDALSIQDIRQFSGTVSYIGLLSFCLANGMENIDGVIAILIAYGMKVE